MLVGVRLCTLSVFAADFSINAERQTPHSSAFVKIAEEELKHPGLVFVQSVNCRWMICAENLLLSVLT